MSRAVIYMRLASIGPAFVSWCPIQSTAWPTPCINFVPFRCAPDILYCMRDEGRNRRRDAWHRSKKGSSNCRTARRLCSVPHKHILPLY
ncbi:hypothetical protein BU23DRAFT_151451 [Bimuria novae-zelandiae CBS 107.79]|uniref:Uncharacterized protein n=1 Tax=Bimuria novae-zelandiae CBS 107.79 TaxID=1447943 RepID=A0A6A5VPT2_9PLEO|nr:hypothetical protein BU23DRAFT_151451 [Bimuria novae-zelandiae CBS 107.79]